MPSYIAPGYHTASFYLIVRDGKAMMSFYEKAFGAVETIKLTMPDGSIAHAEFKIGDSPIMMGEENIEWGNKSPLTLGGTPVGVMIYVPDCDAVFNQALAAGATVHRPMMDQFYGDRSGTVTDPSGHQWTIATHKTTMTGAQMQAAMEEMMKNMPQG
jgi:PhnB protein